MIYSYNNQDMFIFLLSATQESNHKTYIFLLSATQDSNHKT